MKTVARDIYKVPAFLALTFYRGIQMVETKVKIFSAGNYVVHKIKQGTRK